MAQPDPHSAVDAVWRAESARVVGALTRMVHDIGLAEELAQDALVAALEQWPHSGVPRNPGAWLTTIAKRRAIDRFRREETLDRKHRQIARDLETQLTAAGADAEADLDGEIEDDVLRLMFVSCHPVLTTEARTALTLKLLGGLTTAEIARAFLLSDATLAQRIVRAKRALAAAQVPFEVPVADELPARLGSVLEVIYLIFNEGYSATAGDDWLRPEMCSEALRLGRLLADLLPREAEVHGLVALMEIQASRSSARTGPDGRPILLLDQDRARWDQLQIRRGLTALDRAEALTDSPGRYAMQAAIAACHARAATAEDTDWERIAALYLDLTRLEPSPVVELNRAVALSMARGPAAGLAIVDRIRTDAALRGYHLLPSVRGDFLAHLGRFAEAAEEFSQAASLTRNEAERALLLDRAAACARGELPQR